MKSEEAIFFDKDVETPVAIVPRVLRLLLPVKDKDKDKDQKQFAKYGLSGLWL